jgi:hypothetical protein|tara:strand:- start:624 stop:779 length:156 start_codon:yes stop_codon:yes gene_type:complete
MGAFGSNRLYPVNLKAENAKPVKMNGDVIGLSIARVRFCRVSFAGNAFCLN